MANYLIHSCDERLWYVEDILIPSMLEQGIEKSNISVYNDVEHLGNLEAFIQSLITVNQEGGTWHLQDDIVISKQFKRWTEEYDNGIICGFCNAYSERFPLGLVKPKDMWYSFQCMRIPNDIARHCYTWFYERIENDPTFEAWAKTKHDDYIFHKFMERYYANDSVLNLAPNIVDHIDYLLGGSLINKIRGDMNVRSIHWDEDDTLHILIERLKEVKDEQRIIA